MHTAFTGLCNRSAQDLVARRWAQRSAPGEPLAFLMLDIDHFKRQRPAATWPERRRAARSGAAHSPVCRARPTWSPAAAEKSLAVLPAVNDCFLRSCAWQSMRKAIESPPVRLANAAMVPITSSVHAYIPDDSPALDAQIGLQRRGAVSPPRTQNCRMALLRALSPQASVHQHDPAATSTSAATSPGVSYAHRAATARQTAAQTRACETRTPDLGGWVVPHIHIQAR